ncbi:MAG: radical SAM protein [Thermodesulfobacteriota bacterium]
MEHARQYVLRIPSRHGADGGCLVNGCLLSTYRLFADCSWDGREACVRALADGLLATPGPVTFAGGPDLGLDMLRLRPNLRDRLACWILDHADPSRPPSPGVPVCAPDQSPPAAWTVFLLDSRAANRHRMRRLAGGAPRVLGPEALWDWGRELIPDWAWIPERESVYPLDLPDFSPRPGLDVLLLDCPAKNLGLLPNGLAHVHNALQRAEVNAQTIDLDILLYHAFHAHRLLDAPQEMKTPAGRPLPDDPWQPEHCLLWKQPDVIDHFRADMDRAVEAVVEAAPRILGLSIHESNTLFSATLAERVKAARPETIILVGGYSCLYPDIGMDAFPLADVMVIGEADELLGSLVQDLLAGRDVTGTPGVMTRRGGPAAFTPGPKPEDLDTLDFPRYQWLDTSAYRNHNGYQLTPIVGSRGCRWSKCAFCTECFPWRTRSSANIAEEVQWLYAHGHDLFVFNDSDFNGDQQVILDFCREIEARNIVATFTGQLRVDRHNDLHFFQVLRRAGFQAVRFGIDAFSPNTLRTARKGYLVEHAKAVLEHCHEAGIFAEVNLIVGYPGETEQDIEATIANLLEMKDRIGRIAVINPLMLKAGSHFLDNSEQYGISFHRDKAELVADHPFGIPSALWYCESPLIDDDVRSERVFAVARAMREAGIPIGGVASARIDEMQRGEDGLRGGQRALATQRKAPADGTQADGRRLVAGAPFRHGGRFYAIAPEAARNLLHLHGEEETMERRPSWLERLRRLLRPAVSFPDASGLDALVQEQETSVLEHLDPADQQLLYEGFHGYNIVTLGRWRFGIRQGEPFDGPRAQTPGGYPPGACFVGTSLHQVTQAILTHLAMPSEAPA